MAVLKKAAGLVTNPNEINKREGSLEKADNVVIDADDIIEPRRGFEDFGESFGLSTDRLNQLMVYKSRVLRHYNDTLQFDNDGLGSFNSFSGSFNEVVSGIRIKSIEANSNFYFTTDNGIKKISASSASQFSTSADYITDAGGPKATGLEATIDIAVGGFLAPRSKVAYRAVWGIRDANNVLILGYPSERVILSNINSDVNIAEVFTCECTSGTTSDYTSSASNRYIQFSSENIDYFAYFVTAATTDEPVDSGTLGRTPIVVDIDGLSTSADIATALANKIAELNEQFSVDISSSTVTVTSLEEGVNLTNAASSASLTVVTTTVVTEGENVSGDFTNATLDLLIPSEVNTTDYFYQIYRTASSTESTGLALEDIDPGDEMNLVFEANVTSAEISAGQVTGIEDVTPESFRQSAALLYTNPVSGEGILQANEKPPIARDIALFRNTTFYANTKTRHKQQIDMLSVSGLTSGVSSIVIGNSTLDAEYTFIGETQVQDVDTVADVADSLDGTYFLLNSARNERKYYVWYNTGAGAGDPLVASRTGIEIEINTGDTANDVASATATILNLEDDFDASSLTNAVTITWGKNGNTDNASDGTSGFTFNAPSTDGEGEDAASNEVLLSSLVSVGQAIEESALSLCRVINQDSNSPVNAFYISGADDVPGKILIEARELEDDTFYIATTDSGAINQFNPELPLVETLTAISIDDPAEITAAGHGLTTGTSIYLYNTDSTPTIQGKYEVTVLDANTFSIPTTVTGAGTTGNWFITDIESDNEVKGNRIYYSKNSQPEAVPLVNYLDIGPQDEQILRILPLRDNLVVIKEEGVYIITGTSAPNFGSRLLDGSIGVYSGDTAVVLNNSIFCLTDEGVVRITDNGVTIQSRAIEDDLLAVNRIVLEDTTIPFGIAYHSDRSYILWVPTTSGDTVATQAYRYNTFTDTWTRWTNSATCGKLSPSNDKLYLGAGERNYSYEERKNGDRTDYSDRSYELSIGASAIEGTQIEVSTSADIIIGDVIYQLQYLAISQFNRLLLKLDIDQGLDDSDYYSTLMGVAGDSLTDKMDDLNTKLVADDASGTITTATYSSDFATLQSEFNVLIGELNDISCDTNLKNYKESNGTIPYESIILANDRGDNVITTVTQAPFIVGPVSIYKGIETDIIYGPIDFGSADTLKQVREGSLIFDQTNFYSGTVSYSSDRSNNYASIDFTFAGPGYWGGSNWGTEVWGGSGSEFPKRTLIPQQKQRCRFMRVRFRHINARELFRLLGISLVPRAISKRAYR